MNKFYIGLGVAGVIIVSIVMAFFQGKDHERKIWQLKLNEANLVIAELEGRQPVINEVIVTQYVDKIRYIDRVKIQEKVIREYVPAEADQNCTINNGFVTIHNAATVPQEPPILTQKDQEASDVKLSQVATVVVDNYTKYHQVKAQLESLQQWIKEQQKLWSQYE